MHCREQAAQLRPHLAQLNRQAQVALIGVGAPYMAQGFDDEFKLSAEGAKVLTDPSRKSFEAAGMKRGIWRTLGPATWPSSVRTFLRGNKQKRVQGDPWQQGGALVVERGGEIAYRHVNRNPGDAVDLAEIDRALAQAG